MLDFYPLPNPNSVFEFLNQENANIPTWIVSDLKSKNEIQKQLLEKQGFFLESSILRASDFWKIILRRLAPQTQVVASDFIQIVVDNFVEKYGRELEIMDFESSTLFAYVQELAPILLHPQSDSLLSEWFSKQNKIKKWRRWHLLAKVCMKYIIDDHQIIDNRWIAAYLQTFDLKYFNWPSDLVIDLGTEMSSIEMGLFKLLSQKINVKIIWPEPSWQKRYPLLLKTYHDHFGYGKVHSAKETKTENESSPTQFIRVSTQLAEVKHCVSQIRKWYDQGICLENISIISAQIETYWPILKFFLDDEGLTYQKDHVVRLNSLAGVQNFLSYCANLLSEVSWDSLEQTVYSHLQPSDIDFENFKALFYQLYDESDLLRDIKIKDLFYKKIDLHQKISRNEFLASIVKLWSESIQIHFQPPVDQHLHLFEIIFKDFLARSSDVQSDFKKWFQFLQFCINSKEIKIESASVSGIQILPLMSSHLLESPYQIWLGLDEKSLASRKKHLIPISDIFELKTQFDFAIEYPEESFYDFNTRWLLEKKATQKIYLCANVSFEAEPLTPSLFFLEHNALHEIKIPEATRHDEIQNYLSRIDFSAEDLALKNSSYEFLKISLDGIKKDLLQFPNIVLIDKINSLSPSELEDYWKCGFKLLAQKVFRLKDKPQVAVDLDPRQKGSLLHQLFEYLVINLKVDIPEEKSEQDIRLFLNEKRIKEKIYPQDDLFWEMQKNKLALVGMAFIEFEKKRKKSVTLATEKTFELYFNLDKKEFVSDLNPLDTHFKIKGRIDRIDQDVQGLIVYDYKSSTTELKNYGDWLEQGEFQLLLYLLACEKVLYPEQSVLASVYYDYRKFDFSKGLMQEDFHKKYIENNRKKKALLIPEEKNELIKNFNQLLTDLFKKLNQFDFSAAPVDIEICNRCYWSKLCRAHHLN